ncbi:MAG: type IV pilin N-terminal domain-containing protein [Methanoregula sp.]
MQRGHSGEVGVSEVVGEMLMIALVIILISVFAAALYNYLPVDREPSISIMMTNDTLGNVTLWHKGGDWVNGEDLSVIFVNDSGRTPYQYNLTFKNPQTQFLMVHPNQQEKETFDLGSNITVRMHEDLWTREDIRRNMSIKLLTDRSVIYTGRISL